MNKRELVVDAGVSSHKQMRQHVKSLQTENISKVTLKNCDRFGLPSLLNCFTCGFFGEGSFENYNFQLFDALRANPHIEELVLLEGCLKRISQINGDTALLPLRLLTEMKGLKTLVLDNSHWGYPLFKELLAFLSHPACNIETLILLKELTAEEIGELAQAFCDASSLRHYIGPAQQQLQMVLNSTVRFQYEAIPDYEEIQLDEEELNQTHGEPSHCSSVH